MHKCNSAILFIVFNRPELTREIFKSIRLAKPSRLYVSADGPRKDNHNDEIQCGMTRKIATNIDWDCNLKVLFHDDNLGCKNAVNDAINWFFSHEESGIILEDDCLPHSDFYEYCDITLDRYKNDNDVAMITGSNYQNGQWHGDASYYFSNYPLIWGWATWRRSWQCNDIDMKCWGKYKKSKEWKEKWKNRYEKKYWENRLNLAHDNGIDTWDYAWIASIWSKGTSIIAPNKNLIKNIGFGVEATHTKDSNNKKSNHPTGSICPISHPKNKQACAEADDYLFNNFFSDGCLDLYCRLKRYISKLIKKICK